MNEDDRQLRLFGDGPAKPYPGMQVPYVKGSETSESAADSMRSETETLRAKIYDFIRARPSTCDEVEVAMSGRHQSISARITELKRFGRIVDTGERRKTRSNRLAVVYGVASREGGVR